MTTKELQEQVESYQTGENTAQQDFHIGTIEQPQEPTLSQPSVSETENTQSSQTQQAPPPTALANVLGAVRSNNPIVENYTQEALASGFKTSRYDTAFHPSMDLEDNRAREQSAWVKIGTGLTKGAITAGATAVNTTIGTVYGIGNALFELAFDFNGNGRSFKDTVDAGVNNWLSERLIDLQNWSEKALPNYRTTEERSEKYQQEWYKHMLTANFIGDSILKNFGFTVGAMVGGAGWSHLISKAMARSLSGSVLRGAVAASAGDAEAAAEMARAAEAIQRGTLVRVDVSKLADNLKNVGRRLNRAETRLQLYGAAISAMGEGNMEGLMAKNEYLETVMPRLEQQYLDAIRYAEEDMLKQAKTEYVGHRLIQTGDGGLKSEPYLTTLGQNVLLLRQEEITEKYNDLKAKANEEAEKLAGTTFLLNLPILTTSNAIQFGRMYTGGWKTNRAMAKVNGGLRFAGDAVEAGYKKSGNKILKGLWNTAKVAGTEAKEEMLQGTASSGAKEVADRRLTAYNDFGYDAEAIDSVRSWFSGMYSGGIDYLADAKNWQEGALGALTGLFGIPGRQWHGGIVEAVKDANAEVDLSRESAEQLNSLVNDKDFQDRWRGYIRHLAYDREMGKATEEDNQYAWHNANDKQLIGDIMTFAKAGKLEDLNQIVTQFSNIGVDQAAEIRDLNKDSSTGEEGWTKNLSDKEVVDKVKKQAQIMRDAIDEYKDVYDALASRARADTPDEVLQETMFTAMQINAFDRRYLQMFSDTMQEVDPLLTAMSLLDENGELQSEEKAAEKFKQLQSIYESVLGGTIIPVALPAALEKQKEDALDALEAVAGHSQPAVAEKIRDMRKLTEDRKAFYKKLEFLQTEKGIKQHQEEAITQEKVNNASAEAFAEEETKDIETLEDVRQTYFPKNAKDKANYIESLRRAAATKPAAKQFLEMYDLFNGFRTQLEKRRQYLATDAADLTVNPVMVTGMLNDAFRNAKSIDELIAMPDHLFRSDVDFNDSFKTISNLTSPTAYNNTKKYLRAMMKDYRDADVAHKRAGNSPKGPLPPAPALIEQEGKDAPNPAGAAPQTEIAKQHDEEARKGKKGTEEATEAPAETPKTEIAPTDTKSVDEVMEFPTSKKDVYEPLFVTMSQDGLKVTFPHQDNPYNISIKDLTDILGSLSLGLYGLNANSAAVVPTALTFANDGTITLEGYSGKQAVQFTVFEEDAKRLANALAPGMYKHLQEALQAARNKDAVTEVNIDSVIEEPARGVAGTTDIETAAGETVPVGERGKRVYGYYRTSVPEIDTRAAASARKALRGSGTMAYSEIDLSDFVKLHPEYAETWNALAQRGAFTYVANELKVGDELEFIIDPSFPKYEHSSQILVTTKNKEGKRQVLTVLSQQTEQYLGLSNLRSAILSEYNSFNPANKNEVFVFSKKSRVWGKRRGLVRYFDSSEGGERELPQHTKDWPIVVVDRKGTVITVHGQVTERQKTAVQESLNKARRDKQTTDSGVSVNAGKMYILMPLGDGEGVAPVRLGVQHFNEKTINKSGKVFDAIRESIKRLNEIVRDSIYTADISGMSEEEIQADKAKHIEDCNVALHKELANLRQYLDFHEWFFEIKEFDNIGIALRINNGTEYAMRTPVQMSNSWLMNFIAKKNFALDIRVGNTESQKTDSTKQLINKINALLEDDALTSNADLSHPVGVDFYFDAWDSSQQRFRKMTKAQEDAASRAQEDKSEKQTDSIDEEVDDIDIPVGESNFGPGRTLDSAYQDELERQTAIIDNALRELSAEILRQTGVEVEVVHGLVETLANTPDADEALGATVRGKVYLDKEYFDFSTPIHEYTHLWGSYLRAVNPKEWDNIKQLLDGVPELKEMVQILYPNLSGDDLYDEMLAQFSGEKGAMRMKAEAERLAAEEGKELQESAKGLGFLNKLRDALKAFWKGVADLLGIHFTTAEEVADRVLYDWARGFNPNIRPQSWQEDVSAADESVEDDEGGFDEVSLQIGKKRKEAMRLRLRNKLTNATDLQVEQTINEIEKLGESGKGGGDSKLEKAAFHWASRGTVILPEDNEKIKQAVEIADKKSANVESFNSPMELINQFADSIKEKPIDPDTVSTLTNKVTYPQGITVYNVEESEESRQNMRKIINTHFGKNCSPWCLLQGDENGNLTENSARYWEHYNKYPKRVAFHDGKLIAFFASDNNPVWWSREDKPYTGIPAWQKLADGSVCYRVLNEKTGEFDGKRYNHHRGNRIDGMYESWSEDGILQERTEYKNRKVNGVRELYRTTGVIYLREYYENGILTGKRTTFSYDGRVETVDEYKNGKHTGVSEEYNEKKLYRKTYFNDDGARVSSDYYNRRGEVIQRVLYENFHSANIKRFIHGQLASEDFIENDKLVLRKQYAVGPIKYSSITPYTVINGKPVVHGTVTRYYGNTDKVLSKIQYINGKLNGLSQTFAENGTLSKEAAFRFGEKLGYSIEYGSDGSLKEIRWYSTPGHLAQIFTDPSEAVDNLQMPSVVAKQVQIEYFKKVSFSELAKEMQEMLLAKGYTKEEYDTFTPEFKEQILRCL